MKNQGQFSIFKSKKSNQWYWNLKGRNGEIVAQSESYRTRYGARRGARRFAMLAAVSPIVTEASK